MLNLAPTAIAVSKLPFFHLEMQPAEWSNIQWILFAEHYTFTHHTFLFTRSSFGFQTLKLEISALILESQSLEPRKVWRFKRDSGL